MVTKKDLQESINDLCERFNYIASELESLYHEMISSKSSEVREFARRVESIQFNGYANPSQFAAGCGFQDLFDIVEENESVKNLDKFLELEGSLRCIKKITDNLKLD